MKKHKQQYWLYWLKTLKCYLIYNLLDYCCQPCKPKQQSFSFLASELNLKGNLFSLSRSLWRDTGRRWCSCSSDWTDALTVSGSGRWQEWEADGRITSNMVILSSEAKRTTVMNINGSKKLYNSKLGPFCQLTKVPVQQFLSTLHWCNFGLNAVGQCGCVTCRLSLIDALAHS